MKWDGMGLDECRAGRDGGRKKDSGPSRARLEGSKFNSSVLSQLWSDHTRE